MAALRASYHRILDKIEHMLPAKLRPLYNHPAGNAEFTIQPLVLAGWVCVCGVSVWWVTDVSSCCTRWK